VKSDRVRPIRRARGEHSLDRISRIVAGAGA
jgi:hypothetical protein